MDVAGAVIIKYIFLMQKVSNMILFFTADGPQPGEKNHVFFVVPKASIGGGVHLDVCEHFFFWAPES